MISSPCNLRAAHRARCSGATVLLVFNLRRPRRRGPTETLMDVRWGFELTQLRAGGMEGVFQIRRPYLGQRYCERQQLMPARTLSAPWSDPNHRVSARFPRGRLTTDRASRLCIHTGLGCWGTVAQHTQALSNNNPSACGSPRQLSHTDELLFEHVPPASPCTTRCVCAGWGAAVRHRRAPERVLDVHRLGAAEPRQ